MTAVLKVLLLVDKLGARLDASSGGYSVDLMAF